MTNPGWKQTAGMESGAGLISDTSSALARVPKRRLILLIGAFALALATAGISAVPFYTRGEPREALVVREMVEGGGWVLPLRNGTELPRKPPFFHWVGAAVGLGLGGVDELVVRLPSALFSFAAVLLVFTWASAVRGPTQGALTALVTATSVEWIRAATIARVDMVYTGLLTLALVSLDRLLGQTPRAVAWRWALYLAVAAAVLTKGPIALVITALVVSVVAWVRPETELLRRVRPGVGLSVVAGIAGTWFVLALLRHGTDFLDVIFTENFHHMIATDAGGTGHAHGAAYLIGAAALGMLPWTPFLVLTVPALRRRLGEPSVFLAGTWTAVVFGVHLIASAKRSVYVLPAYPALAFLMVTGAATTLDSLRGVWAKRFIAWTARGYAAVYAALALALLLLSRGLEVPEGILTLLSSRDRAGAVAAMDTAQGNVLLLVLGALALMVTAVLLVRAARAQRWIHLILTIALSTGASAVVFNTAIHPGLARQRSMKDFMKTVAAAVRPDEQLYFLGSVDPGIVFYGHRRIKEVQRRTIMPPTYHLLVWERDWRELAPQGRLSPPLKVSASALPRYGHLLLVVAPPGGLPPGDPADRSRKGARPGASGQSTLRGP